MPERSVRAPLLPPWTCRCGQRHPEGRMLCELCGCTRWWNNEPNSQPDPPHAREDYREVWLSGWRAGIAEGRADLVDQVGRLTRELQAASEQLVMAHEDWNRDRAEVGRLTAQIAQIKTLPRFEIAGRYGGQIVTRTDPENPERGDWIKWDDIKAALRGSIDPAPPEAPRE